jgi:hypothetical protein
VRCFHIIDRHRNDGHPAEDWLDVADDPGTVGDGRGLLLGRFPPRKKTTGFGIGQVSVTDFRDGRAGSTDTTAAGSPSLMMSPSKRMASLRAVSGVQGEPCQPILWICGATATGTLPSKQLLPERWPIEDCGQTQRIGNGYRFPSRKEASHGSTQDCDRNWDSIGWDGYCRASESA